LVVAVAGYVFVSYSRRDTAYVGRLISSFEQAGILVWHDTADVRYGDPWEREVEQAVDGAAAMVVVMSPSAEASPHVADELHRMRKRGLPVLPILLEGGPFFALDRLLWFDARVGALPDEAFLVQLRELTHPSAAGARQLIVGDPPGRAVAWQDRPELLHELVRLAGGESMSVVSAVAGHRGVGKTQLAAAYTRLRIAQGWPVVVWAVAETRASLTTALDELATLSGIRTPGMEPEQAARAALRWLRVHPGPCLLVYDNAVDPDLISEWTPTIGAVHTVVTTTRRNLDTLGEMIDVALFTRDEAIAYLHRRTGLDDDAGAADIGEQLGRLPLALAQAAALIGANRRYRDYSRYREALDRADTAALLPRSQGDPYPHGLAEAILLSLDDLAHTDPDGRARRLLDQLAVLAPTGVDTVLLEHLITGADVEATVAALAGRSLTVPARDKDRIVVHRLVQRVVRERRQKDGSLDTLITATADAIAIASDQIGDNWATRTLIAEYATHLETLNSLTIDAATREHLLKPREWQVYRLGEVHNVTAAIALGTVLLADLEDLLGPDHADTLNARSNLAEDYRKSGLFDEAIVLAEQALADRRRVLGPDHPHTLHSLDNLANVCQAVGRIEDAIKLHEQTLRVRERILGAKHPDTLVSRNNLANGYRAIGRLSEAITLHEQALTEQERILGGDHPDTLTSRNSLAVAYQAVGRPDAAITFASTRSLTGRGFLARTTRIRWTAATTSPSPIKP
jgi:tetratricopeptide (TPR) repeat protein